MKLKLPYHSEKTRITVHNEIVEVKAFQIIVWVSVAVAGKSGRDALLPKFPAILDIGNTHNFALTRDHLIQWAGIQPELLPSCGKVRVADKKGILRTAELWLHTNGAPCRLAIEEGIAILDGNWPRLPILGLRALTNSKLQTFIYGDEKRVVIRTRPPWYWPF